MAIVSCRFNRSSRKSSVHHSQSDHKSSICLTFNCCLPPAHCTFTIHTIKWLNGFWYSFYFICSSRAHSSHSICMGNSSKALFHSNATATNALDVSTQLEYFAFICCTRICLFESRRNGDNNLCASLSLCLGWNSNNRLATELKLSHKQMVNAIFMATFVRHAVNVKRNWKYLSLPVWSTFIWAASFDGFPLEICRLVAWFYHDHVLYLTHNIHWQSTQYTFCRFMISPAKCNKNIHNSHDSLVYPYCGCNFMPNAPNSWHVSTTKPTHTTTTQTNMIHDTLLAVYGRQSRHFYNVTWFVMVEAIPFSDCAPMRLMCDRPAAVSMHSTHPKNERHQRRRRIPHGW